MREDVQLDAVAVEVDVADVAMDSVRTAGTNRATETQKGAIFMVASVQEIIVSKAERSMNRGL